MRRLAFAVVFAAHAARALAAPDPIFYLPFEGSLNAAYAKGKPTPSVAAADPILSLISESFAEGVVGKAALLGPPAFSRLFCLSLFCFAFSRPPFVAFLAFLPFAALLCPALRAPRRGGPAPKKGKVQG